MTECQSETMREQLPLLRAGVLGASEATALRAHVARCEACADELAVLERSARLFEQATPRVDVTAILAKLPAAPGARPALRVLRPAVRRFGLPRYAVAAAASLVLVASLSLATLRDDIGGTTPAIDIALDSNAPAVASLPVGMVGGNELSDLGVDDLQMLLAELDQLEATVAAEPVTMQRPVSDAPEGL